MSKLSIIVPVYYNADTLQLIASAMTNNAYTVLLRRFRLTLI